MSYPVDKKLFFTSRNDALAEKYVSVKNELFPQAAVDSCLRKGKKTSFNWQKINYIS